jgi:hypothetical protein
MNADAVINETSGSGFRFNDEKNMTHAISIMKTRLIIEKDNSGAIGRNATINGNIGR